MYRLKILAIVVVVVLLIAAALTWKALVFVVAGILAMFSILLVWGYMMANDKDFFDDLF